jgi:CxxC motif-containing protein (DUF1111 family)
MNLKQLTLGIGLTAAALAACHDSSTGGSEPGGGTNPGGGGGGDTFTLGDPIDGLTADELAAFERGRVQFARRFKPSEGLGAFYNATSCASCHSKPVMGGSAKLYRNFYIAMYGTTNFQLPIQPFFSPVVPSFGSGLSVFNTEFTLQGGRSVIPDSYLGQEVFVTQRNAIPIFGTGLFEFISDATIMANADPNDDDSDGISGRFNTDNGTIGRFGVKSQSNNVELFTRAPLFNQMGITSDPFLGSGGIVSASHAALVQVSANPDDPIEDDDGVPDPEIAHDDLGDLIAFTRFLAPPRPKEFDAAATHGEQLFDSLGCVRCHIPELPSSRGPVRAFTDLLIHEMGEDLADHINAGLPQPSTISDTTSHAEFRTQPLWGVSLHAPFLHDGRAETLEEAVLMHGGEGEASRAAFEALSPADQADVISFLEHL